jgi:hypothetical protein
MIDWHPIGFNRASQRPHDMLSGGRLIYDCKASRQPKMEPVCNVRSPAKPISSTVSDPTFPHVFKNLNSPHSVPVTHDDALAYRNIIASRWRKAPFARIYPIIQKDYFANVKSRPLHRIRAYFIRENAKALYDAHMKN